MRRDETGEPAPRLPKAPAFAVGTTRLGVPPKSREVALAVSPRIKALAPGGATTIDVDAKDARGGPAAGAQVALIVVDEAVLARSAYKLPDALNAFYTQRPSGAHENEVRERVLLGKTEELHAATAPRGGPGWEAAQDSLAPRGRPRPRRWRSSTRCSRPPKWRTEAQAVVE